MSRHSKRSFFKSFFSEFSNTGIMVLSRSLIYPTFISMVPCIAILYTVLNLVGQVQVFVGMLSDWCGSIFGEETGLALMEYIQNFTQNATGMGIIGLVTFCFSFILLEDKVWGIYNSIFKTSGGISLAKRFLRYLAFLGVAVVGISVIMLVRSVFNPLMLKFNNTPEMAAIGNTVRTLFTWASILVLLTLMAKGIPTCHVRFIPALIGASVSTGLVYLLNMVFKFATRLFVSYSVIYGSIATILLFIVFITYFWVGVLIGVLITYVIQFKPSSKTSDSNRNGVASKIAESVDVLLFVCSSYRNGKNGVSMSEIEQAMKMNVRHLKAHLLNMVEIGFLKHVGRKGKLVYTPAKPIEYMDISELIEKEFGIVTADAQELSRLLAVRTCSDAVESLRGITVNSLLSDGEQALIGR